MGISYNPTATAAPIALTGADRATLVRRTYGLVFVGVLVTIGGVAFTFTQPALFSAVAKHPIITFLLTLVPLFIANARPREFPRNVLLTLVFTLMIGIWLAPLMAFYGRNNPGAIGQAGLLTMTTFGVLSAYALLSRRDFSAWGSFFTVGLWVLIATSLINLFVRSEGASLWLAAGTVLVFSGLLVFDTWRIVRSGEYGPDDYVPAAVKIYLDLLNLFLAILRLVGGRRN